MKTSSITNNYESATSLDSGVEGEFSDSNINYTGMSTASSEIMPLYKTEPVYPQTALMRGIEGYVKLKFDIDPKGRVFNIRIIEAYPARIFNRSAKKAVASWKFEKSESGINDFEYELKYVLTKD